LLVDVITEGVVFMELLAGLIIRVIIFRVEIVHELSGDLEAGGGSAPAMKSSAPFGYAPPPPSVARAVPVKANGLRSTAASINMMKNFRKASIFFLT